MTRTGADTRLSSSLIVRMMYCKPVLLVNLGSVYVNFNAGFSEKSNIPFSIIFVSKRKLCVCQSSTQIGKVCLTICTSPPASLCHSLTNHGVISCLKTNLALYLVSLQLPERGKILHSVLHRATLCEQIFGSPVHFMDRQLVLGLVGLFMG